MPLFDLKFLSEHTAGGAGTSNRRHGKNNRRADDAMADKHILHMVTPLKHMSPFDVNMAVDAGFDAVLTIPT